MPIAMNAEPKVAETHEEVKAASHTVVTFVIEVFRSGKMTAGYADLFHS
jgi:hypothetical protein